MFFLVLAVATASFVWWQQTRGSPDHFVRVKAQGGDGLWVYDIPELWAELRQGPDTVNAKVRYELRREGAGHWETRLSTRRPAPRNLVFPSLSLRALKGEYDESGLDQPWARCEGAVEERLEAAYRRYNRLDVES